LVERAAQHDVGLALESGETENRRVAVANKLFTYFLAGLVVAATDVPGQRAVMESAPEAGFLFQPGDAGMLARQLRAWLDDPCELRRAKDRSRQYGESRFCWDREKARLIKAVARVVAR
jgi:glycosyltransferase involved in cell wall biosynthesis